MDVKRRLEFPENKDKEKKEKKNLEKPRWEVGTILDGAYSIGHWGRRNYYRVIDHTKSGAPRVEKLEKEIISSGSTPAESCEVHQLKIDPITVNHDNGSSFVSRWSKKEECWRLSLPGSNGADNTSVSLELHVPGTTYDEYCYY